MTAYADTVRREGRGPFSRLTKSYYEMDGKPLSRPHGAPARVVIPEMYGYKNVKWVERIVVTNRFVPGFWEQRGYDTDAWVGRSNGYG